jgi:hypothetical protein
MALLVGFAFGVCSGDDFDKLQTLKEQRAELALKMHQKRLDMIKNDKSLLQLQKKIIALEKELAIRIDNDPNMRSMAEKLSEIDREIKDVEGGGD